MTIYLPISDETLSDLEQGEFDLSSLSLSELAAALMIQTLRPLPAPLPPIERLLAEYIRAANAIEVDGAGCFAMAMAQHFDSVKFSAGLQRLCTDSVVFLDPETIGKADYLDANGDWDYNFKERQHGRVSKLIETLPWDFLDGESQDDDNDIDAHNLLSSGRSRTYLLPDQQARLFNIIAANSGDGIQVQALAGTGKTHLIGPLMETLAHFNPVLLAMTRPQLVALETRIGGQIKIDENAFTFGKLASRLLDTDLLATRWVRGRDQSTFQVSDASIAAMLGFDSVAQMPAGQVAQVCRRAIMSFCATDADALAVRHLPSVSNLTPLESVVLVEYARRLWLEIIEPSDPAIRLPIRAYHRIKHLSLLPEIDMPSTFSHIIVDEAHDLSAPMKQILDRCQQPTYTFGDALQRIDGDGLAYKRADRIRSKEMTRSMRAGRGIEAIINPVIEAHPYLRLELLEGSRARTTRIRYYDTKSIPIPKGPTTILVGSDWGLFEWFQRLSHARVRFTLLNSSESRLSSFALSAIELYINGVPPSHPALFRFKTWANLAEYYKEDEAFKLVMAMLARGYSSTDFESAIRVHNQHGNTAAIKLGRAVDARNHDFDAVMLTPDFLVKAKKWDEAGKAQLLSRIYIGASRAKHELLVPGYLRDWLSDLLRAKTDNFNE